MTAVIHCTGEPARLAQRYKGEETWAYGFGGVLGAVDKRAFGLVTLVVLYE